MYTNITSVMLQSKKENDILSKTKGKQRQKLKNDKTEKSCDPS